MIQQLRESRHPSVGHRFFTAQAVARHPSIALHTGAPLAARLRLLLLLLLVQCTMDADGIFRLALCLLASPWPSSWCTRCVFKKKNVSTERCSAA